MIRLATALPPEFQNVIDQALTNAAKGIALFALACLLIVVVYSYVSRP